MNYKNSGVLEIINFNMNASNYDYYKTTYKKISVFFG